MKYGFLRFVIVCAMVMETLSFQEHGSLDSIKSERNVYHPVLSTLKKYEMFMPSQYEDYFHGRKKRHLSTEIQNKPGLHVAQTFFTIEFEGKTFILDVSINEELLPLSFNVATFSETGKLQIHKPAIQERNHCYYQGHVRGIQGSQVIMSTCHGLKGCIILPDDFLIFEPLFNTTTQHAPHVIYRSKDVISDKPNGTCGQQDSPSDLHSFVNNLNQDAAGLFGEHTRMKRDISKERKFVELMLVVDNALAERLGDPMAIQSHVIELANYVDGFYQKLDIRVVLSDVEIWSHKNLFKVSSDSHKALRQFRDYRQQRAATEPISSPWVYADSVHFLFGKDFNGTIIGTAWVGTMCTIRSVGVNQDTTQNVMRTAATVAHEMGHNFGMSHDTTDCDCPASADCIMNPTNGFSEIREWTECSRDYLIQSSRLGILNCLVNVPPRSRIYGGAKCGNEIIEEGEECDCGVPENCQSNCCNATTCQLLAHAQCDRGSCCRGCRYISSGSECRGTGGNECDLPEYCSGHSPDCPSNVFLENGMRCRDEEATCQEGVCLSYDMQCQTIWGPTATNGVHVCYETINILGDENGNCGRNSNRTGFLKCDKRNVRCGKLLCSGGSDGPVIGSSRGSIIYDVHFEGEKRECKTIPSEIIPSDEQDPGLVRSGSMCAHEKICYKGECRYAANLTCSSSCNGRGRCNNLGHCHCDYGYAPPYCKNSGNGGSVDSGASSGGMSTQVILLLVMFLVVFPIVLGGGSYVWYRWCGGSMEIEKWKRNREERLKAVRRNKRAARRRNTGGRLTARASSSVPDVKFSNINSAPIVPKPSGQSRPSRPLNPPTAPKSNFIPNPKYWPPAAPLLTPSYPAPPPSSVKPYPGFVQKPTSPMKPPIRSKPKIPARPAPPPPFAYKSKNISVRTSPTSPKWPESSVLSQPYYSAVLTTDSESDEPSSSTSVLQRVKQFNAAT